MGKEMKTYKEFLDEAKLWNSDKRQKSEISEYTKFYRFIAENMPNTTFFDKDYEATLKEHKLKELDNKINTIAVQIMIQTYIKRYHTFDNYLSTINKFFNSADFKQ